MQILLFDLWALSTNPVSTALSTQDWEETFQHPGVSRNPNRVSAFSFSRCRDVFEKAKGCYVVVERMNQPSWGRDPLQVNLLCWYGEFIKFVIKFLRRQERCEAWMRSGGFWVYQGSMCEQIFLLKRFESSENFAGMDDDSIHSFNLTCVPNDVRHGLEAAELEFIKEVCSQYFCFNDSKVPSTLAKCITIEYHRLLICDIYSGSITMWGMNEDFIKQVCASKSFESS